MPNRSNRGRIIVAISLVMLVGGAIVYWAFFQREHHEWTEVIRLWDGQRLQIQRHSSQRVYHGIAAPCSPFAWGGGDPWEITTFSWKARAYRWEGRYIPIAVQIDETGPYIVVFDRETSPNLLGFRIYRATGPSRWKEIRPAEFPKHLAVQNTWLRRNNGVGADGKVLNEYELVAKMDPREYWFRESLTAKLWRCLDDPKANSFLSPELAFGEIPSEDFVRQFKARWIHATNSDQPHRSSAADRPGG
jgi:hypothetical protein